MIGRSCGSWSTPLVTIFICSAGIASATSSPPATTAASAGRRMTPLVTAVQTRDCPAGRRRRASSRPRPFSTRSPSHESMAGRTVSEANGDVLVDDLVDGLPGARSAKLPEVQTRMPGLRGGDRRQDAIDAIGRLRLVAGDLELHKAA